MTLDSTLPSNTDWTEQGVRLAVRSRASYLARHTNRTIEEVLAFASLSWAVGVELEEALDQLRKLGPLKAFMWASTAGLFPSKTLSRD